MMNKNLHSVIIIVLLLVLLSSSMIININADLEETTSQPACTLQDYTPVILNETCTSADSKRRKIYKLSSSSSSSCSGPKELDLGETVSCTCTLEELEPVYTGSEDQCSSAVLPQINVDQSSNLYIQETTASTRTFSGFRKKDPFATCILPDEARMNELSRLLNTSIPCPCTEKDIGSFFTECTNGAYRRLIYFWKNDCDDSSFAAVSLPQKQVVPCNLICTSGESAYSGLCSKCPRGYFSFNGQRWPAPYYAENDAIDMKGIIRECVSFNSISSVSCPYTFGWRVANDGLSFTSGIADDAVGVEARMIINAKIVSFPATLTFEFFVDSEAESDYFEVAVDDNNVLRQSGRSHWQSVSLNLPTPTDAENGQCQWMVSLPTSAVKTCIFPNQLSPYDPSHFWQVSPTQAYDYETRGIKIHFGTNLIGLSSAADDDKNLVCNASTFPVSNTGASVDQNNNNTLLIDYSSSSKMPSSCSIATVVQNAAANGFGGVIFVVDSVLKMRGSHDVFFPAAAAAAPRVHANHHHIKVGFALGTGEEIQGLLDVVHHQGQVAATTPVIVHFTPDPGVNRRIVFSYKKDDFGSSGKVEARVRNIVISGTQLAPSKCLPCQPGQSTIHEGSTSCQKCPVNTYAPNFASKECTKCPDSTPVSGYGATKCVASRPCVSSDFEGAWSACQLNEASGHFERSRYYFLRKNVECDESKYDPSANGGFDPTSSGGETHPCSNNCSYYEFIPTSDLNKPKAEQRCISCKANQVSYDHFGGETEGCNTCPAASSPLLQIKFTDFYHRLDPLNFSTSCSPSCIDEKAFDFEVLTSHRDEDAPLPDELKGTQVLAVGASVMTGSTAILDIPYSQKIPGKVTFKWFALNNEFHIPGNKTRVVFSILDATLSSNKSTINSEKQQFPIVIFENQLKISDTSDFFINYQTETIYPGEIILRWEYTNNQPNSEFIIFGLHQLQIDGAQLVPSIQTSCGPTPPGFFSTDGTLQPCPVGTISKGHSTSCVAPPTDSIAATRSSAISYLCSDGTTPSSDHSYCAFPPSGIWTSNYRVPVAGGGNPITVDDRQGRPVHTSYSEYFKLPVGQWPTYKVSLSWLDGLDLEESGLIISPTQRHGKITFWGLKPRSGDEAGCVDENWSTMDRTYGCLVSPVSGAIRSIGNVMKIDPRFSNDGNEFAGIRLTFSGTKCKRYGDNVKDFTVIIDIDANPKASSFKTLDDAPASIPVDINDPCIVYAHAQYWKATPLCSEVFLAYQDGECDSSGHTTRNYHFVDAQGNYEAGVYYCISVEGSMMLPPSKTISCERTVAASALDYWMGGILGTLFLIIIAGIIIQLRKKNENLKNRFLRLQEELTGSAEGEMKETTTTTGTNLEGEENGENNEDDDDDERRANRTGVRVRLRGGGNDDFDIERSEHDDIPLQMDDNSAQDD